MTAKSTSHPYAHLLSELKGAIRIDTVGAVKWAFVGTEPVSPTITAWWIEQGLIVESKPGVWLRRGDELEKEKTCPTCGRTMPTQL